MESILPAQFWRWMRLCLIILTYFVAVIAWLTPRRYMPEIRNGETMDKPGVPEKMRA